MTIVLCGENRFLVSAELSKLVRAFLVEHGDMGLERLDGEEASFDRINEAVNSLPFLASKKMVVLKNPSKNKQFLEKFTEVLEDVPNTTDLLIIEGKLDKRSAYYKYIKKLPGYTEYNELDDRSLANWLVDYAKQHKATLMSGDARYLVSRVGLNQQLLSNEVDKLISYNSNITKQTIDLLCEPAPQSSIFDLLDASLKGDRRRVLRLYDEQRTLNVEPIQIIALLAWQLHMLAALVFADGAYPDDVAKKLKASPYAVKKSTDIARRISKTKIKQLVGDLTLLDQRIKTQSIDSDDALQSYLLTMTV